MQQIQCSVIVLISKTTVHLRKEHLLNKNKMHGVNILKLVNVFT